MTEETKLADLRKKIHVKQIEVTQQIKDMQHVIDNLCEPFGTFLGDVECVHVCPHNGHFRFIEDYRVVFDTKPLQQFAIMVKIPNDHDKHYVVVRLKLFICVADNEVELIRIDGPEAERCDAINDTVVHAFLYKYLNDVINKTLPDNSNSEVIAVTNLTKG